MKFIGKKTKENAKKALSLVEDPNDVIIRDEGFYVPGEDEVEEVGAEEVEVPEGTEIKEPPADGALSAEEETKEEAKAPAKNASTETWAAYAKEIGVEVPEDAGRDDIIEAVEASKKGGE